jgi:hypothetical protein
MNSDQRIIELLKKFYEIKSWKYIKFINFNIN